MNVHLNWNLKKIFIPFLIAASVLISTYFISVLGFKNGILVGITIIGCAIGIFSLINFRFGFYFSILLGFIIFWMERWIGDTLPMGLVVDIQINVTFLGLLIHKAVKKEAFFKNANHVITYAYLIYTLFLLIEFFNPEMESTAGWFLVIRKFLQFVMIYFISLNLFNGLRQIKFFLLFWTGCAFFAGIYGCYQEWFGFFNFETDWIFSSPARIGLYSLDNGTFRKFSILSGPAAFGTIMAASALLLSVLAIGQKIFLKKIFYMIALTFIVLGMAYSGTRTAYFIFFAGMVLYILMTITNRSTLITASLFFMGFVIIIWGPIYGNPTVNRIRTTFDFSNDASLAVRDINRASIQPYIYSHPIGGGLATSGVQGAEYNPNHYLATFPPDSGFIKTAIETGWIGFFFQCLLYCLILLSGVRVYYRSKSRIIKLYSLGAVVTLFGFIISQYGQVSIGQIPDCFLFYSLLALIVRMNSFLKTDENFQPKFN